jgi:sialidase-1
VSRSLLIAIVLFPIVPVVASTSEVNLRSGTAKNASSQFAGLEQVPVVITGRDDYQAYRIPSLLVTKKGTLLASCEGRKQGGGDAGDIDLLLKRSLDGGRTWAKTQIVWEPRP